jgi:hypothetical protein
MRKVVAPGSPPIEKMTDHPAEVLDEFAPAGIVDARDIEHLFVPSFYFGCEADDPMTALAFSGTLRFGARLNAMFSSDIGHWDVPDITGVLAEAWEPVEDGLITEADFRDFTFTNAARFYTASNPRFFEGTVVADSVRGVTAETH